jgi:hypothetical protein
LKTWHKGRAGSLQAQPALNSATVEGHAPMQDKYHNSAPVDKGWQPIGDLVKRILEKQGGGK